MSKRLQECFGEAVKTKRKALGISVENLAQRVDVTPRYIYKIEAGERMPRMDVALRIIAALEINIKELDISVNTSVESYE